MKGKVKTIEIGMIELQVKKCSEPLNLEETNKVLP